MTALAIVLVLLAAQQFRLIWNYLESCDFIVSSIDGCVQTAYHTPSEVETPRFIPPKNWPQSGQISFQVLTNSYIINIFLSKPKFHKTTRHKELGN